VASEERATRCGEAMLALSVDLAAHVMVASMTGVQVAADHARVYAAIEDLDRKGREDDHSIAMVFVVARDNPAPDAYWRRRFAEQRKTFGSPRVLLSIVTQSAVMRGVLTAMRWIAPEPPTMTCVTHATFEKCAEWVEQNQGTPRTALRALLDDAESGARRPSEKRRAWK
jgi:hypothetical protein